MLLIFLDVVTRDGFTLALLIIDLTVIIKSLHDSSGRCKGAWSVLHLFIKDERHR